MAASDSRFRWAVVGGAAIYLAYFALELSWLPRLHGPLLANLLQSFACFLIALPVGWRRAHVPLARLAWLAANANAFFFLDEIHYRLLLSGTPSPSWAFPLALINPWQFAAFYLFAERFPSGQPGPRWLRNSVFTVATIVWLCSLTATVQLWHLFPLPIGIGPNSPNGIANALGAPLLYAAIAGIVIHNYRSTAAAIERRRIQWLIAAIVAAALSLILFHAANAIWRFPASVTAYMNLPGLLIPLAASYTLLTSELLGVSLIIRRGLQYLLARHTLEALVLLPLAWVAWQSGPSWESFACAVLGLIGLLLREPILNSLDRRFFREAWNREQLLADLATSLQPSLSFPDAVTRVSDKLHAALHPEWLEISHRERREEPIPPPSREAAFEAQFPSGNGVLRLGPLQSGLPYAKPERTLLRAVAAHLALLHENHLLAAERLEAVLAERLRLARELHDTLAQGFAGISIHLESARIHLRDQPATATTHLAEARALAKSSLEEMRRSVLDLRQPAPLPDRLKHLAAEFSRAHNWQVDLACDGETKLQEPINSQLYRIAQEALTNALKHSGATRVRIHLDNSPRAVTLRIEDNGRGFDPSTPAAGFGLAGIRERAAAIGARLRLETSPGSGFLLEVNRESP
jgi:signal transduction histidine kinase